MARPNSLKTNLGLLETIIITENISNISVFQVIKVTKLKFASTEVTYIKIKAVGIFSKTFQNEGI